MTKKIKVLIAAGGTGGHVFPAYSLAKDLIEKNFIITYHKKKHSNNFFFNYFNFIFHHKISTLFDIE